jgi:hypothetical protein
MINRSSQLDGFLKMIRIKGDDHPRLLVGRLLKTIRIKDDNQPQLPARRLPENLNTVEIYLEIHKTLSHALCANQTNGIPHIIVDCSLGCGLLV